MLEYAHFMWVDITQVPLLLFPHFNGKCLQNEFSEKMSIADILPIL